MGESYPVVPTWYADAITGKISGYSVNSKFHKPLLSATRLSKQRMSGIRMVSERGGTIDNTTQKTYMVAAAAAARVSSVRVIFVNTSASVALDIGKASINFPVAATDLNGNNQTQYAVTFSGSASATIPVAAGANRRKYLVSDPVFAETNARTDAGIYPLVSARAYASGSATIGCMGNGSSDNFTSLATKANGRIWAMRYADGDCVTTPANFSNTTNRSQTIIAGFIFNYLGRTVTVMTPGDSIAVGRGNIIGESYSMLAADSLSNATNTIVEYAGVGMAGSTILDMVYQLEDLFAAGIVPDISVMNIASVNSMGVPITDNVIAANRVYTSRSLALCAENFVTPIMWTNPPVSSNVKAWGATDALRVANNAYALETYPLRGIPMVDFAADLSLGLDSLGQVIYNADLYQDGIHPNSVGNQLMADRLRPVLQSLIMA